MVHRQALVEANATQKKLNMIQSTIAKISKHELEIEKKHEWKIKAHSILWYLFKTITTYKQPIIIET